MGETFSSWLWTQLQRREWKQSDFVRRSGFSKSSVSAWLKNERNPDPASCDRIADVLLVDRDVVLALAGHRPTDEEIDSDDPRAKIIALVSRVDPSRPDVAGYLSGIEFMLQELIKPKPFQNMFGERED